MLDGNESFPYKNTLNEWDIRFADRMTDDGIYYLAYEEYNLRVIPLGAEKRKSKVKNNQILYENIYEFVDFKYTLLADMVKEDIILTKANATNSFTFELVINGLQPIHNKDQSIDFRNEKGEVVFKFVKPFAYDERGVKTGYFGGLGVTVLLGSMGTPLPVAALVGAGSGGIIGVVVGGIYGYKSYKDKKDAMDYLNEYTIE